MIYYYIDPPYQAYYENKLFDLKDSLLNRDNTLRYFYNLKERLNKRGIFLQTADKIFSDQSKKNGIYISLGIEKNFKKIQKYYPNIYLKSFAFLEPPVVKPILYKSIETISSFFEKIYLHTQNYNQFSYLSKFSNKIDNIHKLYWPIDIDNNSKSLFFSTNRFNYPVLIQANKKPINNVNELYSFRINKILEFNKFWKIDLYGLNWSKINRSNILWYPYIKNFFKLKEINKGQIASKFDVLSKYEFSLCIENMNFDGYITEKIFDCFFCGTIPIYKGPPNINKYLPNNTFISLDDFKDTHELIRYSLSLSENDKADYRINILNFLQSREMNRYYYSIDEMFK